MGRKEGKKVSRNSYRGISEICIYIFFNISLVMCSVLSQVLFHHGKSLESSEEN